MPNIWLNVPPPLAESAKHVELFLTKHLSIFLVARSVVMDFEDDPLQVSLHTFRVILLTKQISGCARYSFFGL